MFQQKLITIEKITQAKGKKERTINQTKRITEHQEQITIVLGWSDGSGG